MQVLTKYKNYDIIQTLQIIKVAPSSRGKDIGFSVRRQGFESPWGYQHFTEDEVL